MKKAAVLLFAVICICSVSFAQEDTTMKQSSSGVQKMKKDCVKNDAGKLIVMKDGKKTTLEQDITLSNGTIISKDGTVTLKDGTKKQLGEGEAIDMDGNIMPHKKDKSKMD